VPARRDQDFNSEVIGYYLRNVGFPTLEEVSAPTFNADALLKASADENQRRVEELRRLGHLDARRAMLLCLSRVCSAVAGRPVIGHSCEGRLLSGHAVPSEMLRVT
jgi:hypothetical protein